MNRLIAAIAALAVSASAAFADMRTETVDLPGTSVSSKDVGGGYRCVYSQFPGGLRVVELVRDYETIAAAVSKDTTPVSSLNESALARCAGS